MKKRFQDLGQKVEQMKHLIEAAPGKAAQLRDAVFMTTGQLQSMRRDVQATVAGLRAEDDLRLSTALNDIQGGTDQIEKAGYELVGVEMELDPVQRLILLLEKVDDVTESEMRTLIATNATRKSLHGVLSALMKAEEMADQCHLNGMEYCQLRVSVGPIPAVRLIWKSARLLEEESAETTVTGHRPPPPLPAAGPKPTATSAATPTASQPAAGLFGEGSFFERRSPAVTSATASQAAPAHAGSAAAESAAAILEARRFEHGHERTSAVDTGTSTASKSSASALDRFKKMPNLVTRR